MKRSYRVEIDCANCARKVEEAINGMECVENARLIYVDKRLVVEFKKESEEKIGILEEDIRGLAASIESGWKMIPYGTDEEGEPEEDHMKTRILIGCAFLVFGLLAEYAFPEIENGLGTVPMCLIFLIGLTIVGYDVLAGAVSNIVGARFLDENFLMSVATVGALVVSIVGGEGYWTEAVAVMVFYQTGEYFERKAVNKTRKSVKALLNLKAPFATAVRPDGIVTVKTETVEVGETLIVRPGEMIPIDGIIVSGESFMDTKAMTGESVPRHAGKGDEVLSGYINTESAVKIRTVRPYEDSAASKVLTLIEDSAARKSTSERFITKFARVYTPAVVICALALAIVPSVIWPDRWSEWIMKGLVFLVVSCPCALVISVPLTYFCGIGNASRKGILFKGSNYVEAMSKAETAVFDKTGTLTKGEFTVNRVEPVGMTPEELVEYAAHAEIYSNHPIAKSICAYAGTESGEKHGGSRNVSGKGVTAAYNGKEVTVGNASMMKDLGITDFFDTDEPGTHIHVAVDGEYAGHILISDSVKDDAEKAVSDLKALGIRTWMLTGDTRRAAGSVADRLGIDRCECELLPAGKTEKLEEIISSAEGTTVFVGDGINDAPSLARADVGIAMGSLGSDAAVEAADVVIIDDKPSKVAESIRISKMTQRIVWQNIAFALGIKFAILGLTSFTELINMWIAVFGDVGVLIIAIANASRALGHDTWKREPAGRGTGKSNRTERPSNRKTF